jgi:hypothetical protein
MMRLSDKNSSSFDPKRRSGVQKEVAMSRDIGVGSPEGLVARGVVDHGFDPTSVSIRPSIAANPVIA